MSLPDGPYHGTNVTIQDNGLVTLKVHFVADTYADIFRIWRENAEFEGLRRSQNTPTEAPQRNGNGSYDLWITYEGVAPGTPEGSNEGDETDGTWRVRPEWSEEPIESHFAYEEIKNRYGGRLDGEDRLKFDEYLELPSRIGGTSPYRKAKRIKNPMFGRETYFMTGSIVELTQIRSQVPSDLVRNVDRVRKKLPIAALRHVDWGDRDWLEMQPEVSGRGGAVEIVRQWKMSPPGGWPPTALLIDQR